MGDPSLYTAEYFTGQARHRAEYHHVADVLHARLSFATVLDVGCGSGLLLERLKELGHTIWGIDRSPLARAAAPPGVRDRILVADVLSYAWLGQRHMSRWRAELVLCTEVAEHVDAVDAEDLVDALTQGTRSTLFFTAALPGQGGLDHVNEQPQEYWLEKFARRGFVQDVERTRVIRAELGELVALHFFTRTSLVLVRAST